RSAALAAGASPGSPSLPDRQEGEVIVAMSTIRDATGPPVAGSLKFARHRDPRAVRDRRPGVRSPALSGIEAMVTTPYSCRRLAALIRSSGVTGSYVNYRNRIPRARFAPAIERRRRPPSRGDASRQK